MVIEAWSLAKGVTSTVKVFGVKEPGGTDTEPMDSFVDILASTFVDCTSVGALSVETGVPVPSLCPP